MILATPHDLDYLITNYFYVGIVEEIDNHSTRIPKSTLKGQVIS